MGTGNTHSTFICVISLLVLLSQALIVNPTIENQIGTTSGAVGDDVQLRCVVRNRSKNSTVEWFRLTNYLQVSRGKEIVNKLMDQKYDIRVTSANGLETTTLVIKRIDEGDVGRYRCRVKTRYIVYTLWPKKDGFVEIRNQSTSEAPSISPVENSRIEADSGSDVTLTCNAHGHPKPKITWHRDGVRTMMGTGEVLLLRDLKPDHTGWYRCEAMNGIKPPAVQRYHVSVRYKPLCSFKKSSYGQDLGTAVIFKCYVTGYPLAEVKWQRYTVDGLKLLNPKFHRYSIKNVPPVDALDIVMSSLTIYNLTQQDYGTYVCQGTNSVDTCQSSARIYKPNPCEEPSCQPTRSTGNQNENKKIKSVPKPDTKRQQGSKDNGDNNSAGLPMTSTVVYLFTALFLVVVY